MPKQYPMLGKREWILIGSLWVFIVIPICIFPISSYFWYFSAFGIFISLLFFYAGRISRQTAKKETDSINKNKSAYYGLVVNLLAGILVTFSMGFLQIDRVLLLPSAGIFMYVILLWILLKSAIEFLIIFLMVKSIRNFYIHFQLSRH